MKVSKNLVVQLLKLSFAFAIVFFLLRSGQLSFQKVSAFLSKPVFFLSTLGILAVTFVANFYRWKILLRLSDVDISFSLSAKLSMLGQFFSTFMPGSVGGDLVKAVYVARRFPTRRTQTVLSVLLDRGLGLFALIMLGAIGFVLGRDDFMHSTHPLSTLALAAGWGFVCLAILGTIGFVWATWFPVGIPKVAPAFLDRLPMAQRWKSLFEVLCSFHRKPKEVWLALGVAFFVQILSLSTLVLITCSLYGAPPWGAIHVDTFVAASSLGLCLMALPVAPLGLGVGQAAFATMFAILGMQDASFGASVVTVFQLLSLILNLLGFYSYLSYKHQVDI